MIWWERSPDHCLSCDGTDAVLSLHVSVGLSRHNSTCVRLCRPCRVGAGFPVDPYTGYPANTEDDIGSFGHPAGTFILAPTTARSWRRR